MSEPTNTKCPRCGYVTANPFNCPTCANPETPFAATPLPAPDPMARIVSDIEWAIEQASRYQHDSSRWQEKDGAWEAYIAPMLDAVRRALAPNGEAATPDYFAVCDKNGVVLATIPRDRYNRDVFADYSDALGDTHGPLSSIPLFTHPAPAARVTEAMKEKARRALCEVFAEFDDGSWEPASVDELLEVVLTAALSEATNG